MKQPFVAPLLTLGLLLSTLLGLPFESGASSRTDGDQSEDKNLLRLPYEGKETALEGVITLTTERAVGEQVNMTIQADGEVTIEGVAGEPLLGQYKKYTLTSQTITIRGRIKQLACWGNDLNSIELKNCQDLTVLGCSSNNLTTLDLSQCPKLFLLGCAKNQLYGEAMTALVNSLSDRSNTKHGTLQVHKSPEEIDQDGNRCMKSDVAIAKAKGWRTVFSKTNNEYPGVDETAPTYPVTLEVGTGGKASITGATELTAVPKGTTLTVSTTPDKNYELNQILVNGVDCTESKKFVVTEETVVKVTFKKGTHIEHLESATLEVYPNPASDYITVRGGASGATLRLYDTYGSILLEGQVDHQGLSTHSISSIPNGLYMLIVGEQRATLLIDR